MPSLMRLSNPKFCYSVERRKNLGEKQTAVEEAVGTHTKGKTIAGCFLSTGQEGVCHQGRWEGFWGGSQVLVRSYNKAAERCWCWQDLTLSSHGSNVYVLRRAVAAGQEELNRQLQPETGHRTDRQC